jgi:hypothetical protein
MGLYDDAKFLLGCVVFWKMGMYDAKLSIGLCCYIWQKNWV